MICEIETENSSNKQPPADSLAAILRRQRSNVTSSGFSIMTCLPAFAAATAGSMWAPARRTYRYDGDFWVGKHFLQRGIGLATLVLRKLSGRLRAGIRASDQFGVIYVSDRFCVKISNHPAADDTESVSHVLFSEVV